LSLLIFRIQLVLIYVLENEIGRHILVSIAPKAAQSLEAEYKTDVQTRQFT